jgi:condensin-2 complex subunit D3
LSSVSDAKNFLQQLLDSTENALEPVISGQDCDFTIGWFLTVIGELAAAGFMPSAKGLTAVEAIATNRVYRDGGADHFSLPPFLRATAMVCFGKICLQKESIAKRAVTKFAAHLSREEHPVVRNNVLIVLGDLCVVYTGLVDQYLPWVTTCLADQTDLIRFQAAVVVSSLLAEDYIKFKGQIVFRLLYLLSDPNVKIRSFVESVFSRILFLRHSGSLKTLFAETVCALNGFLRHPAYQGAAGNKEFLLTSQISRRKEIYEFMLTSVVTAEQKFNAMMQLSHSLLAAFVDEDATSGAVQIPEREEGPAGQVLIDTLWLISHRALKLSQGPVAADATQQDESAEKEMREKKMFEAALQKKTIVENIVPLLIQLNTVCEQKRSPISKYGRECLKELVKDYKEEIGRIIQSDSQLAQELLFDLGVGPESVVPAAPLMDQSAELAARPQDPEAEAPVNPQESQEVEPPVIAKEEASPSPKKSKTRKPKVETESESSSSEEEPQAKPRRGRPKAQPVSKPSRKRNI